jgi:phosphopentomutase
VSSIERVILLVMDSVGVGATPDADAFGDLGADTLGHIAETVGGASLPVLAGFGLGNIRPLRGVPPAAQPRGAFGKCAELSNGKDTSTGHWELAGLRIDTPFRTFPTGFPEEILAPFRQRTGRAVIGNKAASGTDILVELGPEHIASGALIVYTSADSVFQVAAHEEVVPVEELHRFCRIAREILDPYGVGRVIARPFVGDATRGFQRTYNRKDFAMLPPGPTVLDGIAAAGLPVVGIGKIPDIYCGRGITEDVHTEGNADGMVRTLEAMERVERGLVFTNLVDFDSLYGHRRDPAGYYRCLQEFDRDLGRLVARLDPRRDLVMITADHGNDPTFRGTDHTREYVPILAFGPDSAAGVDLGARKSFADVGATLAELFGVAPPAIGDSFLARLGA